MAFTVQGSSQFTTQFPPGTVDIRFSKLRDVFKGPAGTLFPVGIVTTTGEIRARELLRNLNTSDPDPILPDATENTGISTASDWKVSQIRGAIKFYVIDQTSSTTNDNTSTPSAPGFDFDGLNWNGNLTKTIRKFATVSGTCGSVNTISPAVRMSAASINMTVIVNTSARIYGAGGVSQATYLTQGNSGGVALQVDSAQGQVKVYIAAGSNTYGGGGSGARGSAGVQGATGICPEYQQYDTGQACNSCPGCAGGYTDLGCGWGGGCNCNKGGCSQSFRFNTCGRTIFNTRVGYIRGEGGNSGLGRGYNNFAGTLSGATGSIFTNPGCSANPAAISLPEYAPSPGGQGSQGETGGSGGDWGSDGSGTTTSATAVLTGNGSIGGIAGRAISRTGAGPGTGNGNYAILNGSTTNSTELKGFFQP